MEHAKELQELECHCAAAQERRKWEECEERLTLLLRDLQQRLTESSEGERKGAKMVDGSSPLQPRQGGVDARVESFDVSHMVTPGSHVAPARLQQLAPDSLETPMSGSGQTAGLVTPAITGPTKATLPCTPVVNSPGLTDTILVTSAPPTDQGAFLVAALLAYQVPLIPNCSGENSGG